jgi:hypothetical protein
MGSRVFWTAMLVGIAATGCKDRADPAYTKCLSEDAQGNFQHAWDACHEAVAADPESTSGKAAAALVASPKYVAWKRAEEDRAAKAKFARWSSRDVMSKWQRDGVECPRRQTTAGRKWIDTDGTEVMPNAPHYLDMTKCSMSENSDTYGLFLWSFNSPAELDDVRRYHAQGEEDFVKDNLYLQIMGGVRDEQRAQFKEAMGKLRPD